MNPVVLRMTICCLCKFEGILAAVYMVQVLVNDDLKYGYNVATRNYEDLMAARILDPTEVRLFDSERVFAIFEMFRRFDPLRFRVSSDSEMPMLLVSSGFQMPPPLVFITMKFWVVKLGIEMAKFLVSPGFLMPSIIGCLYFAMPLLHYAGFGQLFFSAFQRSLSFISL